MKNLVAIAAGVAIGYAVTAIGFIVYMGMVLYEGD